LACPRSPIGRDRGKTRAIKERGGGGTSGRLFSNPNLVKMLLMAFKIKPKPLEEHERTGGEFRRVGPEELKNSGNDHLSQSLK